MKKASLSIVPIALLLLTLPIAPTSPTSHGAEPPMTSPQDITAGDFPSEQYGVLPVPRGDLETVKKYHLLHKDVLDNEGKKVGTLEKLILDTKTGKIVYAVVALEDGRLAPVPWSDLKPTREENATVIHATKQQLDTAVGMTAKEIKSLMRPDMLSVIVTAGAVFAQGGIHTVIGEVLQYQVGGFLVRDASGRAIHIEVNEETKLQPAPVVGDRIEARIAANGIAIAIRKLNSEPNENASQGSPAIAEEASADQSAVDENLRSRIEKRLRTNGRIDWEVLVVEVDKNKATLYGVVQSNEQKGLASLIVTTVPGVVGITNNIIIDPGPYTNDHRLQKAIWQSLRSVDALRQETNRLRVVVKQQVTTLSGSVEQFLQREAAEKAARSVPGVEKVINLIQVREVEPMGAREKLRQQGLELMP